MTENKKLVYSGMVIACYVVGLSVMQPISFGAVQVRLVTGLYALAFHNPWMVIPLGLANSLGNSVGGLGLIDMLGGLVVGLLTAFLVSRMRGLPDYMVVMPIAIVPSVMVPLWLSPILGVPYTVLFLNIFVGQTISAYTIGLLIIKNTLFKVAK